MENRLEKLAKIAGKSAAWHTLTAIVDYLDDMEDAAIAGGRLAGFKAGRQHSVIFAGMQSCVGWLLTTISAAYFFECSHGKP